MIKASVIVPAFNAQKTIGLLLDSLVSQNLPREEYEVIVVDDSSTDQTAEAVKKYSVVYFRHRLNQGTGAARNSGAKKAKGEILVFVDSDCLVSEDWLKKHLEAHQKRKEFGIIGGGVRKPRGGNYLLWADYLSSWHNAHQDLAEHEVEEYLPTLNLSIKKEVFKKIGGFWEKRLTGEDVDFCFRAKREGIGIWFDPSLAVEDQPRSFFGFFKHHFNWGYHAPFVRGHQPELAFHWLFSGGFLKALIVFPLLVFGWLFFLTVAWWRYEPWRFLVCLPLIFLGRLVYGLGFLKGAWKKVEGKTGPDHQPKTIRDRNKYAIR